jgi:hypothetical protein
MQSSNGPPERRSMYPNTHGPHRRVICWALAAFVIAVLTVAPSYLSFQTITGDARHIGPLHESKFAFVNDVSGTQLDWLSAVCRPPQLDKIVFDSVRGALPATYCSPTTSFELQDP